MEAGASCARLTPENRQRELRGLCEAAKLPGCARNPVRDLAVIKLDQEDTLMQQGFPIGVSPAWKWLDWTAPGDAGGLAGREDLRYSSLERRR